MASPHGDLLQSIFQSVSDGVIVADRDGRFLLFNRAAREILGLAPVDDGPVAWPAAYGCYLPDKKTPYPAESLPLARALRGERVRDAEIFVRNDGRPDGAWISANSAPLLDAEGKTRGGVVVFRDVTERRENDEVVRRLSEAVSRTADSVFVTDAEGRIEFVNAAFESTTGYGRDESVGRTPSILKSGMHDGAYYEALWATIKAGKVHTGTVINRKKSGELYHAEQTITPIRDAAGNLSHYVSVVRDVTELRKAREREVEMRLAHKVQQHLYPAGPPAIPGLDAYGSVSPAAETCGDYFDFLELPGGRLGIAVGDVRGHGLGAALQMVGTRAYLRSLAGTGADLETVFRRLNRTLSEDTEDGGFVTLLFADVDPRGHRLVYASAGHPHGYVLDSAGTVRATLEATGIPLGIFPDRHEATAREIPLEEGDTIVLLTDGLVEAASPEGEFLGVERVLESVRSARHLDARRIAEAIHAELSEFTAGCPPSDDVTVVVCKIASSE